MTRPADPVVADILKKIERERNIAIGANNLRKETSNAGVIQRCNIEIREAQKNIEYLEEALRRRTERERSGAGAGAGSGNEGSAGNSPGNRASAGNGASNSDSAGNNSSADNSASADNGSAGVAQARKGVARMGIGDPSAPSFTVLDLLKYECPSLGHRIQYMLQLLQFKKQVEEQYREANEKIYKLYAAEGDKKSLALAQEQRVDSDRRLQLIRKALRQYQALYVDADEISHENAVINTYHKNPLTGTLTLTVTAIRNVDHISSPVLLRNPECTIVVKVDDTTRATTKPARTDRWNERFSLEVTQANELSFTVYDAQNGQQVPVAMCWLPLSDIAEEIRRRKVRRMQGGEEWISASSLRGMGVNAGSSAGGAGSASAGFDARSAGGSSAGSASAAADAPNPTASCWFELEPTGQILVTLGFVKSEGHKRTSFVAADKSAGHGFIGLGRHGAIRQRKEKVVEYYGHKFVQKQFYNIMCCAVCGDFLRYTGLQCEDCRLLCHKKCYKNVITKCISSGAATQTDAPTLKHRIPHRWVQVSNRGTKWCCHCGYLLPWGKKNVRKCAECGIMCHASCAHLVPNFCGLSMEKAKQILQAIEMAQERKAVNDARRKRLQPEREEAAQAQAAQAARAAQRKNAERKTAEEKIAQGKTAQGRNAQGRNAQESAQSRSAQRRSTQGQQAVQKPQKPLPDTLSPQIVQAPRNDSYGYPHAAVTAAQAVQAAQAATKKLPAVPTDAGKIGGAQNGGAKMGGAQVSSAGAVAKPAHHHHHHHHRHHHGLDDFRFLAVLGKGNFGKVMLAESVHTRRLCAIKVLKKDFIIQNDEVESTKAEKRVFQIANGGGNPFLLKLHQCFQTENRIYFVMEYIPGGDLMWHVQQRRFSQRRAQFYAAEVLLALKFLHENGVVYRDLKLDNILLAASGHIKLADYGLCKEKMWYGNKTSTFCGTPELMAPEILKEQGYGKAVDWWAFGVLLYQMLLTKSPFRGEDEDEVFNSILTDDPLYPINMSKEAVDILQRLLARDPEKRLGGGERDALEIMEHPYFANIDWEAMLERKVSPPYVPEIKDPRDVACFDDEFTSQAAKLTPVNSVLTPSMQEKFRGFTYTNEGDPA